MTKFISVTESKSGDRYCIPVEGIFRINECSVKGAEESEVRVAFQDKSDTVTISTVESYDDIVDLYGLCSVYVDVEEEEEEEGN